MVQSLYSCGANSIWEYSLLNPNSSKSNKKKPQPNDAVHPNKADFIRSKYQNLTFVYKPAKEDILISESDLSKQLHSSVRTPNLETSLRLLSQGADPNYFHPEKNSTPLSVASRAGQVCQIELLLVYGADPAATDLQGKTAADYARLGGYHGLANRLNNAQYELTDRISFYLCAKRPDHNGSSNSHYLIPEQSGELPKVARKKMTGLNNKVLEDLAIDVYDEVDRRETDAIWNRLEPNSQNSIVIPFLPLNPDYSATRNQGRQKLARLSYSEFTILSIDILKEVKRRQSEIDAARGIIRTKYSPSAELNHTLHKLSFAGGFGQNDTGGMDDDEPLYDSVASDDDYYNIDDTELSIKRRAAIAAAATAKAKENDALNPDVSSLASVSNSASNNALGGGLQRSKSLAAADKEMVQQSEYALLKEQLENSERKVQALIASNDDMRSELSKLQTTVQKLVLDNKSIHRVSVSPALTNHGGIGGSDSHHNASSYLVRGGGDGTSYSDGNSSNAGHSSPLRSPQSPGSRAQSMHEYSRDGRAVSGSYGMTGPVSLPGPGANYMNIPPSSPRNKASAAAAVASMATEPMDSSNYPRYSSGEGYEGPRSLPFTLQQYEFQDGAMYQESLPSQEEVVRRTEAITRCIQELLISAKDEKFDSFIPCSERIVRAVTDMVLLFPEESGHSSISASLSSLTAAATHFESECRMLILRSQKETLNQNFVTQQVIQCAFDIAKATKQLVALFQ